jgi:hypothetical protein
VCLHIFIPGDWIEHETESAAGWLAGSE